jgi:glycosyltransferase involved in cell wall biosynthesis
MRILFAHQNFPAQFRHLAPALAAEGHEVAALTIRRNVPDAWRGVRVIAYRPERSPAPDIHPWVRDFEMQAIRGEASFRTALTLRAEGFAPDVIVVHPGWGDGLFLKDVWPAARFGTYFEFFYRTDGADVGFDPEFQARDPADVCRVRLKNACNLLHSQVTDAGLSPTRWQASTFPEPMRSRITVAHDGIDTELVAPSGEVTVSLASGLKLGRTDEVITFVNRNLEPYRGYHVFMRALPEILGRRPRARALIVGGAGVSYGARPPQGRTWKDIFLAEVRDRLDMSRVHFVGNVAYRHFVSLLQLSTVHVYLTYPFVLSWSLLEAMSAGCAIAASDTEPVREAIRDGETGRLFPFFDTAALTETVCALAGDAEERARLGANARAFARATYDLKAICLPRQLEWIRALANA